ncbi:MAG: NAD(+)/NADH kinase [Clostridiales bacterium]|jgi:NAD+ kinase|nr:NAD(+)/NADH kinase [Clostridiales bacterium]
MKKIGLISNLYKDPAGEQTSKVLQGIIKRNMMPLVTDSVYKLLKQGKWSKEKDLFQHSDIILVLGGDGTILQTSRNAAKYGKPILGINLGRLGFLAEAEMSDLDSILDIIVSGSYQIEDRMMLDSQLIRKGKKVDSFLALNDIAVTKGSFARLIHLDVTINGEFVNHYAADGLLVSSPTGSTAYSLSAGGPVIYPGMECLLLTPICPHTLTSRPIITDAESNIVIDVIDKNREIQVTIDGQHAVELQAGDQITISKSNLKTQLIRLSGYGFFNLLRSKLSARNECID